MLKEIILPLILLIFTQQNFYGTEVGSDMVANEIKRKMDFWSNIDNYMNGVLDYYTDKGYPMLWWLWAILDNVQFQYGNSKKILKHAEAYYGLSNGICFFSSILNFRWFKVGIGDIHINVINTVINYIKIYANRKYVYYDNRNKGKEIDNTVLWDSFKYCLLYSVAPTGVHLLSFKFFNCVKIRIISLGAIFLYFCETVETYDDDFSSPWYYAYTDYYAQFKVYFISTLYFVLSPSIEINIF